MRSASARTSAVNSAANWRSTLSTNTSQGLAMAEKRPSQQPSRCSNSGSGRSSGTAVGFNAVAAADNQYVRRSLCKQSNRNHACNLIDGLFEFDRFQDFQVMDVEDKIAVIGGHFFAQYGVAAEPGQLAGDITTG